MPFETLHPRPDAQSSALLQISTHFPPLQRAGAQGVSLPSLMTEEPSGLHFELAGTQLPPSQWKPFAHCASVLQVFPHDLSSAQTKGEQSRLSRVTHAPLPSHVLGVSLPAAHADPQALVGEA